MSPRRCRASTSRGSRTGSRWSTTRRATPSARPSRITLRAQAPKPADLLRRAVAAATEADVAVVVAGLGEEHECEGYDRTTLELPQEQRELIAAVAEANPSTVVVLSAGAPVLLDWAD